MCVSMPVAVGSFATPRSGTHAPVRVQDLCPVAALVQTPTLGRLTRDRWAARATPRAQSCAQRVADPEAVRDHATEGRDRLCARLDLRLDLGHGSLAADRGYEVPMGSLQERNPSLWIGTTEPGAYSELDGDADADVIVVGA